MLVTRKSPFSGEINKMEISITFKQLSDWKNGAGNIQDIMPEITADEREFIMTGITPEEWNSAFGEE